MSDEPRIFQMTTGGTMPAYEREFWEKLKAERGHAIECYRIVTGSDDEYIYHDRSHGQVYSGFYWYVSTGNIETDVKRLLNGPLLDVAERGDC